MHDANLNQSKRMKDKKNGKTLTYVGTTTRRVCRYSEPITKCSFFTKVPRFRVSKLPLGMKNSVPMISRRIINSIKLA